MSRVVTAAFAASLCVAAAAVGARDGAAGAAVFANGVNLGGWLLTEPSWMYDQFEAAAEGDLVAALRRAGGDGFAVQTMRNHWAGYIPDAALDAFAAWGGTHVRVPVGFWIVDTPVGGGSMLEYGFSHEGFVTGGLNYLAEVIPKLKARGLRALIDMHALPGGASNCQSYSGWQVCASRHVCVRALDAKADHMAPGRCQTRTSGTARRRRRTRRRSRAAVAAARTTRRAARRRRGCMSERRARARRLPSPCPLTRRAGCPRAPRGLGRVPGGGPRHVGCRVRRGGSERARARVARGRRAAAHQGAAPRARPRAASLTHLVSRAWRRRRRRRMRWGNA